MSEGIYTASKSRSQRPGWSTSFRHPLRNDANGRPGLKMRRGLGTTDEAVADRMVAELNTILSDQTWWNAAKRREAEVRFAKPVVDAFYDEIQAGRPDPAALRETHIHLPTAEDGYSRVLFVGTTGAGKTSLLRQLIGSDPKSDKFPSTAPAKTTIADIEVIMGEGAYEAVVTFFTEFQVQANIEECIADACLAVIDGAPIDKIADRFLNHRDQKFRLAYLLGAWKTAHGAAAEDELSFDSFDPTEQHEEGELTEAERARNFQHLERYLERVRKLATATHATLKREIEIEENATGADRQAAQQLIEENFDARLAQSEDFLELVQDVLEDVKARFDFIESGDEGHLERLPSGWPQHWLFKCDDRARFLQQIRWFSSNHWPEFGRLLTPLVEGIRVRGPLFPGFTAEHPKLALIDGQGLGHTPDSSSSVTTHVTQKFADVDVILLVDNAQQPMQAAALSVLRALASSGHHQKLAVAFTHFDQIRGTNLRALSDQRAHVMASVLNALASLRDSLGAPVVRAIEHDIDRRCFMLGGVDRSLDKLPPRAKEFTSQELDRLVTFFEKAIEPPPLPEAHPIYDPAGIGFALQDAVSQFQAPWLARLGLGSYEGVRKEHWTRVKALNRRIAGELDVEYDTLRPVADLVARLNESISRFLDKPLKWTRNPAGEQEEQSAIDQVRRAVSTVMHDLAMRRLVQAHLSEWRKAFDGPEYRGPGSTYMRARTIRDIYEEAAPQPDAAMTMSSANFLREVRQIVTSAIEANGGEVQVGEAV